jgi:hypothetical protein
MMSSVSAEALSNAGSGIAAVTGRSSGSTAGASIIGRDGETLGELRKET